ncbi:hypothetical protein AOLI_G00290330 [Acnodon oligacanthus]
MHSLYPNSEDNWDKQEKPWIVQGTWTGGRPAQFGEHSSQTWLPLRSLMMYAGAQKCRNPALQHWNCHLTYHARVQVSSWLWWMYKGEPLELLLAAPLWVMDPLCDVLQLVQHHRTCPARPNSVIVQFYTLLTVFKMRCSLDVSR